MLFRSVRSFQQNRKLFWENGSSPNYTQSQALFQMPLILNFELAGYGYLSEIETRDITINIENNGSKDGETLLNGKDMFRKYRDVENYIKTQLGDKKLYFADFNIIETTENNTAINIHISYATLSTAPPHGYYTSDFPIIPINTIPEGSTYGSGTVLADWFTRLFNPYPNGGCACRVKGDLLIPTTYSAIAPDNYAPATWFVYHTSSNQSKSSDNYKIPYCNWIKAKRLERLPANQFATSIWIAYFAIPDNIHADFRCMHIIYVNFAIWGHIPELFTNNLPEIN